MDNSPQENDFNGLSKEDVSINMGLELTFAPSSSCLQMKKRKRKLKSQNNEDADDNFLKCTSINPTPVREDFALHSTVNTCLNSDLEVTQPVAETILSPPVSNSMEGVSPSFPVVQGSSVKYASLSHVEEAPAPVLFEKVIGEVVARHGTSLLVAEEVSLEKTSNECTQGECACGGQEKKIQIENSEEVINERDTIIGKEGPQPKLQLLLGALHGNLRKKLIVLDVNGLLADIVMDVFEGYTPDAIISKKAVFKRPFCDDFLRFCFATFHVGVWSSRTKRNVKSVLDFLMGESKHNLLFCWDQSHCTDTGFSTVENRDKPLLLKELKRLWEKDDPDLLWERGEYDESNTLLLDDSPYKALRNPPHTAIFPQTYKYKDEKDNSLGPGGDLRAYLEGLALADNVQKYVELNPFGQRAISETNLSWKFYLKVLNTMPPPHP